MPALDLSPDAPTGNASASPSPARGGPAAPGRNPRVRAAFAYAVPFLPALWLLLRERRNRFIRLHAARSLTFFAGLVLAQIVLFAALVLVGATVTGTGTSTSTSTSTGLTAAALIGVFFYVLYLIVAAFAFVFWLLLMRDALAGRASAYPLLGGASRWLEQRITSAQNRIFPPPAD